MSSPITDEMPLDFDAVFTEPQRESLRPATRWRKLAMASDLTPTQRHVAHALHSHLGGAMDASCNPSQATIAEETGYGTRAVMDALKVLEERGWIDRYRWSRRSSTLITLCWPALSYRAVPSTGPPGTSSRIAWAPPGGAPPAPLSSAPGSPLHDPSTDPRSPSGAPRSPSTDPRSPSGAPPAPEGFMKVDEGEEKAPDGERFQPSPDQVASLRAKLARSA